MAPQYVIKFFFFYNNYFDFGKIVVNTLFYSVLVTHYMYLRILHVNYP